MSKQNSIGVVSKVFPNIIVIEIPDTSKINNNFQGDLYLFEGVNTFVTIYKSKYEKFIYQIVSLYEQEKPYINQEEESKFSGKAYFEAVPIGEIQGKKFEFGLSKFPMIGYDVYMTLNEDIDLILQLSNKEISITLGTLATHNNYLPKFSLDNMLSHHMSILGNTGSGKSTTARKLLHEIVHLFDRNEIDMDKVNFIIFDVHDEYEGLPKEHVNRIELEEISIPLETLKIDDWINLVQPSSAAQLPILMQGLRMANLLESHQVRIEWIQAFCALELYNNVQTDAVAKRTKIIGLLSGINSEEIQEILKKYTHFGNFTNPNEEQFKSTLESYIFKESGWRYHECKIKIEILMESAKCAVSDLKTLMTGINIVFLFEEMKGNSQARSYCSTLVSRIENLISSYSNSMFDSNPEKRKKFKEGLELQRGFTLIKFSGIEDADLLFFTGYILRFFYNQQKASRKTNGSPHELIHFIFDEAHKYINDSDKENIRSLKIFEQIAKEGRKFGMFMILVSQRPSELSRTVLSQCNNYILHRIRNNIDIEQMRKSIPYINESQLRRISYLKTGSALLVGEAFSIPMELIIDGTDYGEHSKTLKPSDVWKIKKV
ncbi:ATP-binding protein [Planococcus liqunii]|uniref:ATP-binding protein n=1 Tax=Planococcus liqunii TaxID=3058394 RepID=UPI002630B864|nr:ATP-binding protein [Planococcus sp. N056]WKA51709.1 ATP-binding protein [Planococcus sp. N056]